jgi:hypothetical protein
MALEIWKAPAGLNYAGSKAKPPEGEGWEITGYNTVRIPMNPNRMGSGFRTEQVPVYGRLAPAPAPPPPPTPQQPQQAATNPSYGKAYNYTDPGDKGFFGMKDYDELMGQGASRADLIRYAFSAPSGVGSAVASKLGIRAYDQPIPSTLSYTDPGDQGFFGMKDFEELAGQGASLQQIQDYAKKAKYGVGEEAASILGLKPVGESGHLMAQADRISASLTDAQKRAEEAAKLQDQLRIESQATMAANMSRSGRQANLQIAPASGTPQTAGTQTFRRRGAQFAPVGALLGGLNIGSQLSTLNV